MLFADDFLYMIRYKKKIAAFNRKIKKTSKWIERVGPNLTAKISHRQNFIVWRSQRNPDKFDLTFKKRADKQLRSNQNF